MQAGQPGSPHAVIDLKFASVREGRGTDRRFGELGRASAMALMLADAMQYSRSSRRKKVGGYIKRRLKLK